MHVLVGDYCVLIDSTQDERWSLMKAVILAGGLGTRSSHCWRNYQFGRSPISKCEGIFCAQQDLKHESEWLDLDSNRANEQLSVRSRLTIEQSANWTIDWCSSFLSGQSAMDLCLGQINNYLSLAAVS
jgi:hypothetical protein